MTERYSKSCGVIVTVVVVHDVWKLPLTPLLLSFSHILISLMIV